VFIACWSVKGGSGTTVVAASLALLAARGGGPRRRGRARGSVVGRRHDALLVDLAGDIPAVMGQPEPNGPGVADWLRAGLRVPPDGWGRLESTVTTGLGLVPRGRGPLVDPGRAEVLAGLLGADGRTVVVDCGIVRSDPVRRPVLERELVRHGDEAVGSGVEVPWSDAGEEGEARAPDEVPLVLAASATVSLLVMRPCYLALRRAAAAAIVPSGVVVVSEPERSLSAADIEDVLGVPVVAEVVHDPAVARAVDSGLLAHRLPRGLERSLRDAA
jgi:hypothetical protein